MLKSQEFVAKMLGCDPEKLTLIAVTQHNQGPEGSHPSMVLSAYYMVDENIEDVVGGRFYACDLYAPASIQKRTENQAAQALWKSENQRFNPDYPEVAPKLEDGWLAPHVTEEMGISLTSSLASYEVLVGAPGCYNGKDYSKGDHVVTSHIAGGDHDVLMKNASHIRFR